MCIRDRDYADQTTITVQLVKDKSPVEDMFIAVTDKHDNYCAGNTGSNGQLTVPGTTGTTNEDVYKRQVQGGRLAWENIEHAVMFCKFCRKALGDMLRKMCIRDSPTAGLPW